MAVERRAEELKNGAKEGTGTAQRDQIRRELPTNGSHPRECRRQNRCSRGEPEATDSRRRIANLPKESDVREADGRSRHAGEPRQGAPSGTPQRWSTGDRRDADGGTEETPGDPLGEDPGEVTGRDLCAGAREASRNTEAERGRADAGNPDGSGSVHSAVAVTSDDSDLRGRHPGVAGDRW